MKKGGHLILFCLAILSLSSCRANEQASSAAFLRLTGSGEGHFRGSVLGQTLSEVQAHETATLKIRDEYGLIYTLDLGEGMDAGVEYYTDPADSTHRVVSIISNISLPGEVEASSLYRELQSWLDARYDIPDGGLGYFHWTDKSEKLEVILRLMDSKTAISINFFRSTDKFGTS